jgi:LysR family transcriptional regulator for bpeEF and oprC
MDHLLALRVFVRIAETGAFARAADTLSIPRPTVTKLVQDLERHLGTKLLQRTTRRVSVTPEGAAYYERAARLLVEVDEMDAQASSARVQLRGRLRVDVGSSIANVILIPALPSFRASYPDIALDLGVSDRHVDLVGDGVDCVIRSGALADTSLVARRIAELEWVTCASPVYLGARGVPRHPSELAAPKSSGKPPRVASHVVAGYFSSLTGRPFPLHFQRGKESVVIEPHTSVGVNESTAHVTALLAGLGVGQTFRFMADPLIRSGALQPVLEDWTQPRQPLQLVYPSARHLNAKLRAFSDWVARVFEPFDAAHAGSRGRDPGRR